MKKIYIFLILLFILLPKSIQAAPYFYLDDLETVYGNQHQLKLYLYSDQVLNLAQTIFTFNTTYLSPISITVTEKCFPSPADPVLGYGFQSSPYFYNGVKAVVSCGFYNPGYSSSEAEGDLMAIITFGTEATGSSSLTFDPGTTKMYYIGSSINPGAMSDETFTVNPYIENIPDEPPDYADDSISSADLNFVEIGTLLSSLFTATASGSTGAVDLTMIEEDNTIPIPGNLPEREKPTPLLMRIFSRGNSLTTQTAEEGEVLAVQSLRELLIPGKSSADKTIVLFNLISVLTFLLILGILIWKFINIKRMNKIRSRHMSELLMGELAVIETKIDGDTEPAKDSVKSDIDETLKKISEELKK